MAYLQPFRAWRFNPRRVPLLAKAVAPMADAAGQQVLQACRAVAYNAIHLVHPEADDPVAPAELVAHWKTQQWLVQDPIPAFYPYEQRFVAYGQDAPVTRRGFMAFVDMRRSEIVVHEDVIQQSVLARAAWLQAAGLQTLPPHLLYDDPDFRLEQLLAQLPTYPLADLTDHQGVRHTLRQVTDANLVRTLRKQLLNKPLYVADGHHRLAAHQAVVASSPPVVEATTADYQLAFLSNLRANDLIIQPTHRLVEVATDFSMPDLLAYMENWFVPQPLNSRQPFFRALQAQRDAFILLYGQAGWLLVPKTNIDWQNAVNLDLPLAVKQLSYTYLHYFVFDRFLQMPYAHHHTEARLRFERNAAQVQETIRQAPNLLGCIMPGVSIDAFLKVCASGARMPLKSTYFYPKVLGGLAFADLWNPVG
jgi:uncharacterized protein (DUF1015 family)